MLVQRLLSAALFFASSAFAISKVSRGGRYLYTDDDGNRFYIRGVAYQVHSTLDPISDDRLAELRDDIRLFKELGLNTLFVCMRNGNQRYNEADLCIKIASTIQKSIRRL